MSSDASRILEEFDGCLNRILTAMMAHDEASLLSNLIKASELADRLAEEGGDGFGTLAGLFIEAWTALLIELDGPLDDEEILAAQIRGFDRFLPKLQRSLGEWFSRN